MLEPYLLYIGSFPASTFVGLEAIVIDMFYESLTWEAVSTIFQDLPSRLRRVRFASVSPALLKRHPEFQWEEPGSSENPFHDEFRVAYPPASGASSHGIDALTAHLSRVLSLASFADLELLEFSGMGLTSQEQDHLWTAIRIALPQIQNRGIKLVVTTE